MIRHRAGSLHTVRCTATSAVLHVVSDLVGIQLTIDQLLGVLSSECETHITFDDSAAAVSLCAGRAQSHATQQRRSGGDTGEKSPHLHENPLSCVVYVVFVFANGIRSPTCFAIHKFVMNGWAAP